jgi:hypothetical protein
MHPPFGKGLLESMDYFRSFLTMLCKSPLWLNSQGGQPFRQPIAIAPKIKTTNSPISEESGWMYVHLQARTFRYVAAFTTRTGHPALLTTDSATLPSTRRRIPRRLFVPITMRSAITRSTWLRMTSTGFPGSESYRRQTDSPALLKRPAEIVDLQSGLRIH